MVHELRNHKLHYSSRKYIDLVSWIACNDNAGSGDDLETIASYVTTTMIAHCYKLNRMHVAEDVMLARSLYLKSFGEE